MEIFRLVVKAESGRASVKRFDRIPIEPKEITELISAFLGAVQDPFSEDAPTLGHQLFEILFGSAIDDLKDGEHLIFAAHDMLELIPFEALIIDPSQSMFLGDKFNVSYVPSATVLALGRQRAKGRRTGSPAIFLVGDPSYDVALNQSQSMVNVDSRNATFPSRMVEAAHERGYRLEPLPGTRTEVLRIARLFQARGGIATVLLGDEAREALVKEARLDHYQYLHFATHGLLSNDIPYVREPALVLSLSSLEDQDGFLKLSEILQLDIDADTVVLSACNTGVGKYIYGEGFAALARAFMYAGAQSVVASLWSVADESTALLMESFYRYLFEGKSKAQALRLAKSDLKRTGYDHPFFWAPFILWGE